MNLLQDGAEPSAVSVTLYNLQRLSHFAEDRHAEYQSKAQSILRSNSQLLEQAPFALATMVSAGMVGDSGYRQVRQYTILSLWGLPDVEFNPDHSTLCLVHHAILALMNSASSSATHPS